MGGGGAINIIKLEDITYLSFSATPISNLTKILIKDKMSDLASKLQQKIKTYKKQIEEAEEIAALNLAKYRKAQQELEETEERSRMAEAHINTINRPFWT